MCNAKYLKSTCNMQHKLFPWMKSLSETFLPFKAQLTESWCTRCSISPYAALWCLSYAHCHRNSSRIGKIINRLRSSIIKTSLILKLPRWIGSIEAISLSLSLSLDYLSRIKPERERRTFMFPSLLMTMHVESQPTPIGEESHNQISLRGRQDRRED